MKGWLAVAAVVALVQGVVTEARAQRGISFGVTGGAAVSSISTPGMEDAPDLRHATNWSAGIFAVVPLGGAFSLQPEALYARKGALQRTELTHIGQTIRQTYVIDYAEVPLLVRMDMADELPVTPFLLAGPVPAVALGATLRTHKSDEPDVLESLDDRINDFDLGILGGAGIEGATRFGTVQVHARYTAGLLDVAADALVGDNRNRSFGVLAAWSITSPF